MKFSALLNMNHITMRTEPPFIVLQYIMVPSPTDDYAINTTDGSLYTTLRATTDIRGNLVWGPYFIPNNSKVGNVKLDGVVLSKSQYSVEALTDSIGKRTKITIPYENIADFSVGKHTLEVFYTPTNDVPAFSASAEGSQNISFLNFSKKAGCEKASLDGRYCRSTIALEDAAFGSGVVSPVAFKIEKDYSHHSEVEVFIDNEKLVYEKDYILKHGSTIVEISPNFMNALLVGDHDLAIAYSDGTIAISKITVSGKEEKLDIKDNNSKLKSPNSGRISFSDPAVASIDLVLLIATILVSRTILRTMLARKTVKLRKNR